MPTTSTSTVRIADLEDRIDAQLDGLMTSVEIGWECCAAALEFSEPGEQFTATVIVRRSHETRHIQTAVEAGLTNLRATAGLISALGWVDSGIAQPWISRFLSGKDLNHKFLGVAACSVRRDYPGELLTNILNREDCLQHTPLHARSLRLIGELRRLDLMSALQLAAASTDPTIAFWANWSIICGSSYNDGATESQIINRTNDRKQAEKDRDQLIAAGWYRKNEIELKDLSDIYLFNTEAAIAPQFEIRVNREAISNQYSRLPLNIMARYVRQNDIALEGKFDDNEKVPDELNEAKEAIYSKLESPDVKNAKIWLENAEDWMLTLRNKYFHFSAKMEFGLTPRFVDGKRSRRRYYG